MTVRNAIRAFAMCAVAGPYLIATPAAAGGCDKANCKPAADAKRGSNPLRPQKFVRRTVALGPPARAIKTPNGGYARVTLAHRSSKLPAPPQFLPVVVSPQAAAAFAMQASAMQAAAQVRVVDAADVNAIDLAADDAPIVPIRVLTTVERPVQVVSANEINAIDRKADVAATPASDKPDRTATAWSMTELRVWLSRIGSLLGSAATTALAAVRSLVG